MSLALGAVVTNDGQIGFTGSSAVVSGRGMLRSDGAITVYGGGPSLNTVIAGSGSITLAPDSSLALSADVGSGQTLRFSGTDALTLAAPAGMHGTLAGFAPGTPSSSPG